MKLRGAIFDMDGTVVDVPYDWKKIKEELMTQGKSILSHIQSLSEPEKSAKWHILETYEQEATQNAVLKPGMGDFLRFIKDRGLKTALVTNNSRKNVQHILEKFCLDFDFVLSRERGLWKPSGAPFSAVLKALDLRTEECCVIGDTYFDIEAAREVGIDHVFILNEEKEKFAGTQARIFASVEDLRKYIEPLL